MLKAEEDEELAIKAQLEAQLWQPSGEYAAQFWQGAPSGPKKSALPPPGSPPGSPTKGAAVRGSRKRSTFESWKEPEPEPEPEPDPELELPKHSAVVAAAAQVQSVHLMFVSVDVVREILDAERREQIQREEAARAAVFQAEQDRVDSVKRTQEAERQWIADVKAAAAYKKAQVKAKRAKAVASVSVDVNKALPEPKWRSGDLVQLAVGSELMDEQLEKGCLRGEIVDGSVTTPAVIAKVTTIIK